MTVPEAETLEDWERIYKMVEKEIDDSATNLKFIIFKKLKEKK